MKISEFLHLALPEEQWLPVLRSVFQDSQRCWIQAGAGIIAQSTPERELTETREKLASIAPYLMV